VQAKMLRVLEEQRFEPVGGTTAIKVDVRVISATNKDLDELIESGDFRADLFYRLNVIPFEVPPLRERHEDIPALVQHFNQRFSGAYGKQPKFFTEDALERLQNYSFPGNVRELRNTIERVVIMNTEQKITGNDLPKFAENAEVPVASFRFPSFKDATDAYQREFIMHKLTEAEGNVSRAAELMGVDRSHLYRRMKSLGINAERAKPEI
jgi:two-component system nitrogen regulation response regulator NtrX